MTCTPEDLHRIRYGSKQCESCYFCTAQLNPLSNESHTVGVKLEPL